MMLREFLSKLRWDQREDFAGCTFRHLDRTRGTGGRTIARLQSFKGSDVLEIGRGYLVVSRGGDVAHIPFHRVTQVLGADGSLRWSRGR